MPASSCSVPVRHHTASIPTSGGGAKLTKTQTFPTVPAHRAKRQEFEAFLRKDEQRKKDDAEAALRWAAAKGDQAVTEAIERVMYQRKQQNVALRQKIRQV